MGENQLRRFRNILYGHLNNRADAIISLLDALTANTTASTVVELSLSPLFPYGHDSLYEAISAFQLPPQAQHQLLSLAIPQNHDRPFWLFCVDVSPHPRPYADTLPDRSIIYNHTPIKGNKPITIGHRYSTIALLPERNPNDPPWIIPLHTQRVKSNQDPELTGAHQLQSLFESPLLPFLHDLKVIVGDSKYSKPSFLLAFADKPDAAIIVRVRNNRVFYRAYRPHPEQPRKRGHPRWYGQRFALNNPETWPEPDEETTFSITTRKGKLRKGRIRVWQNILMRGSRRHPMHRYPFTLLCVEILTPEGKPVYKRPLWLIIFGLPRQRITAEQGYQAYNQRFDIEHYFRFAKRRLLLTSFQTPIDVHEEHWWQLAQMAYLQLWLARDIARALWHPWQRYLAKRSDGKRTPTQVQRDFGRIIRQIGTPARAPKRRGKSPGWPKGVKRKRRPKQKVVKKARKKA